MDPTSLPPELIVRWSYTPVVWEDAEDSLCEVYGCTSTTPEYEVSFGDDSEESDKLLAEMENWGIWFLVCLEHKDYLMEHCNKA